MHAHEPCAYGRMNSYAENKQSQSHINLKFENPEILKSRKTPYNLPNLTSWLGSGAFGFHGPSISDAL